uniref:Uncharacterized protein n=1 Tax=Romanomermis culicivorax TaxID=13658 RepID=A0A915HYP4_ROMCU
MDYSFSLAKFLPCDKFVVNNINKTSRQKTTNDGNLVAEKALIVAKVTPQWLWSEDKDRKFRNMIRMENDNKYDIESNAKSQTPDGKINKALRIKL